MDDVTKASEVGGDTDLINLVKVRRSVRAFREEAVSTAVVEEILADAVWAPSPHNSQPWRFTVMTSSGGKNTLATAMARSLADELRSFGTNEDEIHRQTTRSVARISSAPVVIVLSLVRDGLQSFPDERRNELEWLMAVQSVGAVLQNLFLLALTRGIATCWMAAPMYCPEVVARVLDLPSDYSPQALVLMGYQAAPGKVRGRRPFDTVVDVRAET